MFPAGPKLKVCAICSKNIEVMDEKVQTDKFFVHKACFKCAICDAALIAGRCSQDIVISQHYGPIWFCFAHMTLGSGEKLERMKAKHGEPKPKKVALN